MISGYREGQIFRFAHAFSLSSTNKSNRSSSSSLPPLSPPRRFTTIKAKYTTHAGREGTDSVYTCIVAITPDVKTYLEVIAHSRTYALTQLRKYCPPQPQPQLAQAHTEQGQRVIVADSNRTPSQLSPRSTHLKRTTRIRIGIRLRRHSVTSIHMYMCTIHDPEREYKRKRKSLCQLVFWSHES